MQGQIIKIISNHYSVSINNEVIDCQARGVFRNKGITPLVGDFCLVNMDEKVITEILPRNNELNRPCVSNVDVALIVTSIKEPNLSLNLLDKLIVSIIHHNITPLICLTKLDLMTGKDKYELKKIIKYYESIGIKTFNNKNIGKLKRYLKNKTIVLTGQTGAGKSSLLNLIDPKLKLEEGEISHALGRGKHTTRHVELYKTNKMLIADTPGFSSIEDNLTLEELKECFKEFSKYPCPYSGCNHFKEIDCNVKKAVKNNRIMASRYENYLKIGGLK